MRRSFTVLIGFIGAVAVAVAIVPPELAAQAQEQRESVADAAKRARAHKKPSSKPAKVLTNDDLAPAPVPAPSTVATGATEPGTTQKPAEAKAAPTGAAAPKPDDPEKVWRQRFAGAYRSLNQTQTELDVLQREWSKAQAEYYPDPQKALKEQYTRKDINEHQKQIDAKKKEIERLRQGISDMEDQLRREGGDPSWARP